MTHNVRRQFDDVKRLFFPRWDREGHWRVTTKTRRSAASHGICDLKRRVIEISARPTDADEMDRLLIHEICHAVAVRPGHGKEWQARMEKAAQKAEKLGRSCLAQLLREEIAGYQNQSSTAELKDAYDSIVDWVWEMPGLTLEQVKNRLADKYGLLDSEVRTVFPRTEKLFRKAKNEASKSEAMRLQSSEAN
jgi:hypothetical protein